VHVAAEFAPSAIAFRGIDYSLKPRRNARARLAPSFRPGLMRNSSPAAAHAPLRAWRTRGSASSSSKMPHDDPSMVATTIGHCWRTLFANSTSPRQDEQPLDVIADLEEGIAERPDVVEELRRQVLVHYSDPKIVRVHASARGTLVKHHQLLAQPLRWVLEGLIYCFVRSRPATCCWPA
jgi:hypothetical protein